MNGCFEKRISLYLNKVLEGHTQGNMESILFREGTQKGILRSLRRSEKWRLAVSGDIDRLETGRLGPWETITGEGLLRVPNVASVTTLLLGLSTYFQFVCPCCASKFHHGCVTEK